MKTQNEIWRLTAVENPLAVALATLCARAHLSGNAGLYVRAAKLKVFVMDYIRQKWTGVLAALIVSMLIGLAIGDDFKNLSSNSQRCVFVAEIISILLWALPSATVLKRWEEGSWHTTSNFDKAIRLFLLSYGDEKPFESIKDLSNPDALSRIIETDAEVLAKKIGEANMPSTTVLKSWGDLAPLGDDPLKELRHKLKNLVGLIVHFKLYGLFKDSPLGEFSTTELREKACADLVYQRLFAKVGAVASAA